MARPVNVARRRASPLFSSLGSSPAQAQRHAAVELGLSDETATERAVAILAEHRQWRELHFEAWQAGERAPEPPHAATLDVFARPGI